jgi:hypothetical protein
MWRADFCSGVGAQLKIITRTWKGSAKRCKSKLIDVKKEDEG